jgi:hypothetical protein
MDEPKPPIPPSELHLRRNDPVDRPSVAIYFRNEEEVGEGFVLALRLMGIAAIEQNPEPVTPAARDAAP